MHRTDIADSIVRATARLEADPDDPRTWSWVEASVWTDRRLAALSNGVRGGKWHSLIDKVYAAQTLWAAWQRVAANHGAAGIDRMSIERFEAQAARYLGELARALREGSYQPEPVRRVHIPQRQEANPALRDLHSQGSNCADGLKVGVRAHLRKGISARQFRFPAGTKLQGCTTGRGSGAEGRLHLGGGCRSAELLRHDPEGTAVGPGQGEGQ